MREDMYELLLERPRGGRRIRHVRRRLSPLRMDEAEAAPKRVSIGRGIDKTKWLSENLAPLRRYLESRLGEPWDQVYSEIRRHLRFDCAVQLHVLQHLFEYVELYVDIIDGVPCSRPNGRVLGTHRYDFYVCPETGALLRRRPKRRHHRGRGGGEDGEQDQVRRRRRRRLGSR